MGAAAAALRPRPEQLGRLPTLGLLTPADCPGPLRRLARRAGVDFLLELKLVTAEARYWLCTRGAERPAAGLPDCWVEGHVLPEYLLPGGGREFGDPDGPAAASALQAADYVNYLRAECDRLEGQHEREPSHDLARRVEEARVEVRQALLAWRRLSGGRG